MTARMPEPGPTRPRPGAVPPALAVAGAGVLACALLVVAGRIGVVDGAAVTLALLAAGLLIGRLAAPGAEPAAVVGDRGVDREVARFADGLTEPFLILNERSVLVYCNPSARLQFPRLREGDPLAFTLRDPDLVEAIDAARTAREARAVEVHLSVPNEVWLRASVAPYEPDPESGRLLLIITLHDFTEQRRTDRMRSDFIANASHELRTPLTSLMGFIETLQGPAATDAGARDRFLSIMRTQAGRMSALIDDLLSLSRIELRQHVKPTAEVRLQSVVREVSASLEARLAEAGVTLELDLPEESAAVTGDAQELYEVVENLVDNAIKYGGSGGRVSVAVARGANRAGTYHAITVTDYGPGIAQEHVPRLTERFYRVESEGSRKAKGTGLGLAIVKHIVHRHHGEMAIRSTLGEGTRVEVLLPRRS
ncbi:sensor histidine kinase [Pelagibacterium montanilacus]|uniref:sensor histidine kinase n=1 Tax=Pelagibacterium montanilacus TaxID=2185280 RepID=UPI0013DFFA2B|nr:ATP-binding protein [Pelagibacterium montanilacus]